MASRKDKDSLLAKTGPKDRPDGVLIGLYHRDKETGQLSFLINKQFRPPIGAYVYSLPAGLIDKKDGDVLETAKREALEEAGAVIGSPEIICETGSTSSGLSDETNAIVVAEIIDFRKESRERFEDITSRLYTVDEIKSMFKDPSYFFADAARLLLMYLMEKMK